MADSGTTPLLIWYRYLKLYFALVHFRDCRATKWRNFLSGRILMSTCSFWDFLWRICASVKVLNILQLYNVEYEQVASFPFDDHNCPPIHLIKLFCQSAYSWLKEDILNVVVVHCKAGMARTGLMICSLLLFLKVRPCTWKILACRLKLLLVSPIHTYCFTLFTIQFFPTAEECINYYNQKRCVDGKALILLSQIVSHRLKWNILIYSHLFHLL